MPRSGPAVVPKTSEDVRLYRLIVAKLKTKYSSIMSTVSCTGPRKHTFKPPVPIRDDWSIEGDNCSVVSVDTSVPEEVVSTILYVDNSGLSYANLPDTNTVFAEERDYEPFRGGPVNFACQVTTGNEIECQVDQLVLEEIAEEDRTAIASVEGRPVYSKERKLGQWFWDLIIPVRPYQPTSKRVDPRSEAFAAQLLARRDEGSEYKVRNPAVVRVPAKHGRHGWEHLRAQSDWLINTAAEVAIRLEHKFGRRSYSADNVAWAMKQVIPITDDMVLSGCISVRCTKKDINTARTIAVGVYLVPTDADVLVAEMWESLSWKERVRDSLPRWGFGEANSVGERLLAGIGQPPREAAHPNRA